VELQVLQGDLRSFEADAVVVNLFQGVSRPGGATGAVDESLGGAVAAVIAAGDLTGKLGDTVTLYTNGRMVAPRVIVVGLGPAERFGAEEARRAAGAAAAAARKLGVERLATIAHGAGLGGLAPRSAAQATVEGTLLALYQFRAYKSAKRDGDQAERRVVRSLTVLGTDAARLEELRAGAAVGESLARAVQLGRDLANHPGNVATPAFLAERAAEIADRHGMRLEVWDRARIEAEGMGALAAVARGSHQEPRFIVLEHAPPAAADHKPYVLVGKGLTFDSGGISLKPGKGMGAMKFDMCGAAAVLGALEAVGHLGLPVRVMGIVAAAENMPGGNAAKPGDIVTALNGTTIEILNTDAEGRLVLADALAYARRLDPAAVVDLATLTGAVVVALGKHAAGLFANDDDLAAALIAAGEKSGERVWRMPLWPAYGKMIESDVADIKNVNEGEGGAGAVFGGKFLERFVDYPWAHVDIAGVAWSVPDVAYIGKGASGYGVRLVLEWLQGLVEQ